MGNKKSLWKHFIQLSWHTFAISLKTMLRGAEWRIVSAGLGLLSSSKSGPSSLSASRRQSRSEIARVSCGKSPSRLLIYSSIRKQRARPRGTWFVLTSSLDGHNQLARRQHSWTSGAAVTVRPMKRDGWTMHMWQIKLWVRKPLHFFCCSNNVFFLNFFYVNSPF